MGTIMVTYTEQEFKQLICTCIEEVLRKSTYRKNPDESDELLDIKQAASLLKLEINTLYEKTSRKLIPHFKKGNKLYFNKAELMQWVNKGRVKTIEHLETEAATYILKHSYKKAA